MINVGLQKKIWLLIIPCVFFLSLIASTAYGQKKDKDGNEGQEVYLAFRYGNVINNMVTSYYKDQKFYLPVVGLFNLLHIEANTNIEEGIKVSGTFADTGQQYEINFSSNYIKIEDKKIELHASDYVIKDIDFFITPALFKKVFNLSFSIDFNNLSLDLETPDTMPVVAQAERQQKREHIQSQNVLNTKKYDLKYGRKRHLFNGGFLDYDLSSNISDATNIYTYNAKLGAEVLGGDIQGSLFGSYSKNLSTFTTNSLRWRYVTEKNPWISQIYAGQINSMGLTNNQVTGIKISNEPVRPRILFDKYIVDGSTLPQSDVELYLNNALIDYQKTDALGNYRFNVPLTYGNSKLDLRIYGPDGQLQESARRIQVPFTFLPPGETNYTVSAGKVQNPLVGTNNDIYTAQGQISSGISTWLTGTAGVEYYGEFNQAAPTFYGSVSSRIMSQYLLNIKAAPDAFYKASTNVVYPSSAGWGIDYTYYNKQQSIYNRTGANQELSANFFFPFQVGKSLPFNLRFLGSRQFRNTRDFTQYQLNLSTRIKKLNVRLGYRDSQMGSLQFKATGIGALSGALTYTISRTPGIPTYLRGSFLRLQTDYNPVFKQLQSAEFLFSRSIFNTGRVQFDFRRNFQADFNTIGLNFTVDFNKVRSNSTLRTSKSDYTLTNTFMGSLGYDNHHNRFVATNRQQVGRAGAAVRMYIDNNNSGKYDHGDELIPENAARLSQSGGSFLNKKTGLTYLTQLRPYDQYNLEINMGAIKNPLLIPKTDKFSFVTDPDAYKPIEIPFYITGIIDGRVEKALNDSTKVPVAGLKLFLSQKNGSFTKEFRTFSDGSFYAYKVPPGEYELRTDSTQLSILGTISTTHTKTFEVKALAAGDFITGLNFTLVPKTSGRKQITQNQPANKKATLLDLLNDQSTTYEIQLERFKDEEHAQRAAREAYLLFGGNYRVLFNSKNNLYTLRSYPINDRKQAFNKLFNIQKSPFQNAVLVVTLQRQLPEPPQETKKITTFSVQLGAYSVKGHAAKFAAETRERLGINVVVQLDENIGLYKVSTEPLQAKEQAITQLSKIKNKTPFGDAFLTHQIDTVTQPATTEKINLAYNYNILIEGVTPQTQQAYLSSVTGESDIDINQDPKKDMLVFKDVQNLQEALNLKQKLAQVSTIGQPIIILVEYK